MPAENARALAEALKRCESEPIQFIGAIQNHGVLLAVDGAGLVRVASGNLPEILGMAASAALGQPAELVIGAAGWAMILALPISAQQRQPLPLVLTLQRGAERIDCQAQVHRAGDLLVVEIESSNRNPEFSCPIDFESTDRLLSALLADTDGIDSYAAVIADQVQKLTGFDRVMVYQFDRQWSGKIIAESRTEGMASFLGNHFPASDIPPAARELYTQNLVRILVDRDAPAIALHQSPGLAIDLSFSVLRSMSPIHLEYLFNLGVRASLTVSLLQNGRLWGLIACHHESPRQLTFKLRQSMELVARTVATRLSAIAFNESSRYYAMVRDILPKLVGLVQAAPSESILAPGLQQEVLGLVNASGAVIASGKLSAPIGTIPSADQLEPLLDWLRPRLVNGEIFVTHALALDYPPAAAFSSIASGLLAIGLDESAEQVLLWFREEVVRAIPWAGEAAKYLVEDEQGPKLEPRRSFARWMQTQRGESPQWSEPEVDAARMLSLTLAELFARQQLRLAEESRRLAASVYENSSEAMLVADANNVIIDVNPAFTALTGYSAAEAIGQNTSILKSGRHDPAFYRVMWEAIKSKGVWSGEIWNRRKNGEIYPEWLTINSIVDASGAVHRWVALFTDMTERKAAADQIEHLAFYDQLTQLPNRRLMLDRLRHAFIASTRRKRKGALMLIDLDNFKTLNDTLGHAVGDQLLVKTAARLVASIRDGDTVARLGGDEFVVILEDLEDGEQAALQAEGVAAKIHDNLGQPYQLNVAAEGAVAGKSIHHSTTSIGIALFDGDAISADELVKRADTAMYQAKAAGRNTLRFFDPQMQAVVKARAALELDLRKAIDEGQFLLYYQAQVDSSGRVVGAEVLVRWQHPERGLVAPAEFIPLAEDTGLILPLGHWVMETACAQLAAWVSQPDRAHLTLAVNVSARQFCLPNFVDLVLALIDKTGIRADRLKLELTESLLLDNAEDIITKMSALKTRGVCFSLDDFGTGYSSLSYLKRLPLDQLKIDQSFVRDLLTDPNDAAIAQTIVALGQSLGLAVIAEGVETATQRDILASLGCLAYQGYFFSRPVPLDDFEALLLRGQPTVDSERPSW